MNFPFYSLKRSHLTGVKSQKNIKFKFKRLKDKMGKSSDNKTNNYAPLIS